MRKHIVLVAGEASGDNFAASLVNQLKDQPIDFSGVGGQSMKEAGVSILFPLANYGVTGLTEVIKQFSIIKHTFHLLLEHIKEIKPDLVILVDYPGFNLRLAKQLKSLPCKVLYYISPQIWAWKKRRIHTIKKYIDYMAVIFPFEKPIYQQANVPVYYVGHPLKMHVKPTIDTKKFRVKNAISLDATVLGLAPGSRLNEIQQHLPTLLEAATKLSKQHANLEFVMPVAPTLNKKIIKEYVQHYPVEVNLIENDSFVNIMNACDYALVASGTASLECALLKKPMVIFYKTSRLTYMVGASVIQVKYIAIINLLAEKMIVPELIQDDFTAHNIIQAVSLLIANKKYADQQITSLNELAHNLDENQADCPIEKLVCKLLALPEIH